MTRLERYGYPAAVVLAAGLAVITALNQPYNQNEWAQIEPYDSWDPGVVTSGTRQPPLDPLLGSWVQHVFGVGQLQQRLVPVAAAVATLVLLIGLLRRLRVGEVGVVAAFAMATAPVFLRYAAYARPYALPVLLMVLAAYAGTRWVDEGRRRWLVTAVVAAFLMPLSRVPEPVTFLGTAALVLALLGWRRRELRPRAWTLAGGFVVALVSVGALAAIKLSHEPTLTHRPLIDLNPSHALHRLPNGLHQLRVFVAPLYADWFPWWPFTLLVVLVALLLPASRRRLLSTSLWWWLPLALGPLVFLVAYHSVNTFPLVQREYRPRFAYFWVPSLTVAMAVAGHAVAESRLRAGRWLGLALVGAVLVTQLPMTWWVLTHNHAADVEQAAAVVQAKVPKDAVVLYDGPSPNGFWHQPFFGQARFFTGDHARIVRPDAIAAGSDNVPGKAGPVYLLLLDGPCVYSVACDAPEVHWGGRVAGYRVVDRFDRFTLYAPTQGQRGRNGAIQAIAALADAFGSHYNQPDRQAVRRLRSPHQEKP